MFELLLGLLARAIQTAEAGGSQVQGQSEQLSEAVLSSKEGWACAAVAHVCVACLRL